MTCAKKVQKLKDGVVISEYDSIKRGADSVGLSSSAVRQSIRNGTKCAGYNWQIKDEAFQNETFRKHPDLDIECSNIGRVRHRFGKISPGYKNPQGYRMVTIANRPYSVARLVAQTFIPNPDNKPTVDHVNRVRDNNNIENLRWYSHKEQCTNREWVNSWPRNK